MSTRRERAARVVLAMIADVLRERGRVPLDDPRLLESVIATQAAEIDLVEQFAAAEVARDRAGLVERVRSVFTNEVIRAICALARQQNVCREQAGQVVFVTGMEAAREYTVEQLVALLEKEG